MIFQNIKELRRAKSELEKSLNIEIKIQGRKVEIKGSALEEYEASIILDAINSGFSAKKALLLKDESKIFRTLNIKDFTKKKNLEEVRARIIGKDGKTKKTIENIADCDITIRDNTISIIADSESIEELITAITSLIKGTKQSNTYRYLEKMNRRNKDISI